MISQDCIKSVGRDDIGVVVLTVVVVPLSESED